MSTELPEMPKRPDSIAGLEWGAYYVERSDALLARIRALDSLTDRARQAFEHSGVVTGTDAWIAEYAALRDRLRKEGVLE